MNATFLPKDKTPDRKEGDCWSEDGKSWTIKNGVKRTTSTISDLRRSLITPLSCPRCKGTMKGQLNEQMWTINQTCFNCLVDQEHQIRMAGKWEEYEHNKIVANANAFCADMESALQDILASNQSKSHVTEDGQIENWQGVNQDQLKSIADREMTQLRDMTEEYKNKQSSDEA